MSAVAAGDALTVVFSQGVPQYEVTPQSTAQFTADPSGQSVILNGNAGALITLRGFQMTSQGNLDAVKSSSLGPELMDIKKIGDFEGVVTVAVGLKSSGCAVVSAGDSSLQFRFITGSSTGG